MATPPGAGQPPRTTALERGAPDPDLGRLLGRGEQQTVLDDAEDRAHLQPGRGDRLPVQLEAACSGVVPCEQQAPPRQPTGHAGHEVDPVLVVELGDDRRGQGGGVHGEQPEPLLVPGLHGQGERPVGLPDDVGEVAEGLPVPLDLPGLGGPAGGVERDDEEPHLGVRGARRRVPDRSRRRGRVRGVAEVPDPDRGDVDAGHGERVARRRPPQPLVTPHLLGGDELRQAPGHPVGLPAGLPAGLPVGLPVDQRAVADPVGADEPRSRRAHVGDRPPVGGEQGRHGGVRRQPLGLATVEVGDEELPTDREHGPRERAVGVVARDATSAFAGALASGALRGRELVGRRVAGAGDQPLLTLGVEHPQPRRRVVACEGA